MDHFCVIQNLPHWDLLSAYITYLIVVFGEWLERTILDLYLAWLISPHQLEQILKNYMRAAKDYSRALI